MLLFIGYSSWASADQEKAVSIGAIKGGKFVANCAGNFIENDQWVMTAGHCFNKYSPKSEVIIQSSDRKSYYVAKSAFWIHEGSFLGLSNARSAAKKYDLALVEVQRYSGPESTGAFPKPMTYEKMESLRDKIAETVLVSIKTRTSYDLARAERYEDVSLIMDENTSWRTGKGDSGSAVLTESYEILAVTSSRYQGNDFSKPLSVLWQTRSFLVPIGLCALADNINRDKAFELSSKTTESLSWLDDFSKTCPENANGGRVFEHIQFQ